MSAVDIGQAALEAYRRTILGEPRTAREATLIAEGRGGYELLYGMAARTGRKAGEILARDLTANYPDLSISEDDAKAAIRPVLLENYKAVSGWAQNVQAHENEKAGIGMAVVQAEEPDERIDNYAGKISENGEVYIRDLPSVAENISLSTVDDTIKANADLHYQAGLSPMIIRTMTGKGCAFCAERAGEFDYTEVKTGKKEVFRRHQNCRCVINYEPGDGSSRNVFAAVQAREAEARAEREALEEENTDYQSQSEANEEFLRRRLVARSNGKPYDATEEWLYRADGRNGKTSKIDRVNINGVEYVVDGKYVLLEPDGLEMKTAEILARDLGVDVTIRPRVIYPRSIQSADYNINGEKWDLKSPKGSGTHTIYGVLKGKHEQADSFIINTIRTPLSVDEVKYQVENEVFRSTHMEWVRRIIIVDCGKVACVYER